MGSGRKDLIGSFPVGIGGDVGDEIVVRFGFWSRSNEPLPSLDGRGQGHLMQDIAAAGGGGEGVFCRAPAPSYIRDEGRLARTQSEIAQVTFNEMFLEQSDLLRGMGGAQKLRGRTSQLGKQVDRNGQVHGGIIAEQIRFDAGKGSAGFSGLNQRLCGGGDVCLQAGDIGKKGSLEEAGAGVDDVDENDFLVEGGEFVQGDVMEQSGTEEDGFAAVGREVGGAEDEGARAFDVRTPVRGAAFETRLDIEGGTVKVQFAHKRGGGVLWREQVCFEHGTAVWAGALLLGWNA